mgnify:CR=1 FL=1
MPIYQAFADIVDDEEEWEDPTKIRVEEFTVDAENADEANEKALDSLKSQTNTHLGEYYIWEITEKDRLDEDEVN